MSAFNLGALLLASPDPVPLSLIRAVRETRDPLQLRAILARPELTEDDLDVLAENCTAETTLWDIRAAFCARVRCTDQADLAARIEAARGRGRRRTSVGGVVAAMLENPCVRPETVAMLAASDSPEVVAAYAQHTRDGVPARVAALLRLQDLKGAATRRMGPVLAGTAARAIEEVFEADPAAGRDLLLDLELRPVLLALCGTVSSDGSVTSSPKQVFGHLDEACRNHLVTAAIVPVYTEASATKKDLGQADWLVRDLASSLEVEAVQLLLATGRSYVSGTLERRLRDLTVGHPSLAEMLLAQVQFANGPQDADRERAAAWLLPAVAEAADGIGWQTILEAPETLPAADTTIGDLRDLVEALALAPAAAS